MPTLTDARASTWPAPRLEIEHARALLASVAAGGGRVIVAPDRDVDGLAAGALVIRAVERLGGIPIPCLPAKGEHVHTPAMRARLSAIAAPGAPAAPAAAALVVLDMGSRAGPIVPGLPTIVLDHHDARERPDGAIFVSAAGCEPVAPTALLAYEVLRTLVPLADLAWLARLGVVGDLGDAHPFAAALADAARFPKTHVREAVALLNAARRAARYRPALALEVLLAAREPADIAKARVPGVDELAACRAEVTAEVARVARVAPRIAGGVAVIRFASGAQIHPLVATRWAGRLAPNIVMAINDGYLPGRSNFALRCAVKDVDLLAFLRGLPLGAVAGEFANGHPRATGGSVPPHELERILRAIGFADPLPRAAQLGASRAAKPPLPAA